MPTPPSNFTRPPFLPRHKQVVRVPLMSTRCAECGSPEQVTALTEHLDLCRTCRRVFTAEVLELRRLGQRDWQVSVEVEDVTTRLQRWCGLIGGGLLLCALLALLAIGLMSL
jgi:ribosomal protein S14